MTLGAAAVVFLAVVGVTVFLVAMNTANQPEDAAGHDRVPPDTTDDRFYRTADRPAGPDAEDDPAATDRPEP